MVGSADIPHESFTESVIRVYGYIPLRRGRTDRAAMTKALNVLQQGGIVGIFPEGGIWEVGQKKAHTGVAWLSKKAKAPVLPIGFSGTLGSLTQALKLKRPKMIMNVGKPIPPAILPKGTANKPFLEQYAEEVMAAVKNLVPADDPMHKPEAIKETFELRVALFAQDKSPVPIPEGMDIEHPEELAKFFHRPIILKIFKKNLDLPVDALQGLDNEQNPRSIANATEYVLGYLDKENPYLLSYRFGPKEAEAMRLGLEEMSRLAKWADERGYALKVTPIRRYITPDHREIVQIKQGKQKEWM
jgi:1-acyl-sn-glycerol-3-phosphate acyltransferase